MRFKLIKTLSVLLVFSAVALAFYACKKENTKKQNAVEEFGSVTACRAGYEWDPFTRKCVPVCPPGYVREEGQCVPAPPPPVIVNYAGVSITYETGMKVL